MIEELLAARWFGGKSRGIQDVRVIDRACWADDATLSLVEVQYEIGAPDIYVFADRLDDPSVPHAVLRQFCGAQFATDAGGALVFRPTHLFDSIPLETTEPIGLMRGEQSNTSIRYGDALILKLFRRLQFGPNPDVEVGRFLTEQSQFRGTPAVVGSLDYLSPDGQQASLALLQRVEPNPGDAWPTTPRRLRAGLDGGSLAESVDAIARLGHTTAELHLPLASGSSDLS